MWDLLVLRDLSYHTEVGWWSWSIIRRRILVWVHEMLRMIHWILHSWSTDGTIKSEVYPIDWQCFGFGVGCHCRTSFWIGIQRFCWRGWRDVCDQRMCSKEALGVRIGVYWEFWRCCWVWLAPSNNRAWYFKFAGAQGMYVFVGFWIAYFSTCDWFQSCLWCRQKRLRDWMECMSTFWRILEWSILVCFIYLFLLPLRYKVSLYWDTWSLVTLSMI